MNSCALNSSAFHAKKQGQGLVISQSNTVPGINKIMEMNINAGIGKFQNMTNLYLI